MKSFLNITIIVKIYVRPAKECEIILPTFSQSFNNHEAVPFETAMQMKEKETAIYKINLSLVNLAPNLTFFIVNTRKCRVRM